MRNWKTTVAGLLTFGAIVAKAITAGHFDFSTDGPAAMAAIGLIFAKDFNVTGGTTPQ